MNEEQLRAEAKEHIMRNRKAIKEFSAYPLSFLNKLFGLRYNLRDPLEKQIRDYVKAELKNKSRETGKFDTIVYV
jgi:protein-disulfide isomerase-like protein with CxxC motif